ncbi:MAG TPA: alpha/beta fold hydrolase [Intrasporangiaceae bacterium]|nr:alpha/beta fold hydrolase [Intrasporangiaceae bacterium]
MPPHTASPAPVRRRRRSRAAALGVSVALVATLASGCTELGDQILGRTPTPSAGTDLMPEGLEELATFYEQRLDWVACGAGECAELTVPLNYAEPDGETIEISLLKVPASGPRNRIGSIVVNPGGPGGSGVDYAAAADFIVGPDVRRRYDVVGFDPRGVGRSAPIDCVPDAELDDFLGTDPTPDDAAEEQQFADVTAGFAKACAANAGPLLAHVSTVDAAKDMDILRAALGEEKLTYLGKSYGTYLGTVYAEQFTDRVGRFVLDGAVPPDLTSQEVGIGQAEGFDRATKAWAQDCIDSGSCPLGDTVDEVVTGMGDLMRRFDAEPVPVRGDSRVTSMSEGWAALGVAVAMYDQGMWSMLTDALGDVVERDDATALMALANRYADRTSSGSYTGNIMEAIFAVNCLDRAESDNLDDFRAAQAEADRRAPLWGRFISWSSLTCGFWEPDVVGGGARTIAAAGSAPIVVIGTTRDPATPYEWSERLADQLESGVLVSFDGDGHTAYMRSNSCVDKAIDAFYLSGTVPEDGLRC